MQIYKDIIQSAKQLTKLQIVNNIEKGPENIFEAIRDSTSLKVLIIDESKTELSFTDFTAISSCSKLEALVIEKIPENNLQGFMESYIERL
jgi:hypothetical protein